MKNLLRNIFWGLLVFGILFFNGCGSSKRVVHRTARRQEHIKLALEGNNYRYDMRAGIVELDYGNSHLRFLLNSSWVLIDGREVKLPSKTILSGNYLLVSPAVVNYVKNNVALKSRKKKKFIVMLDPGHGGKDPGAMANGIREKDVVLDVAKRVKALLVKYGVKVVLTRDKDVFVSLKGRAKKANRLMPDVFVSIHANASRKSSARGVEVYYVSERVDDSTRAVVATENSVLKLEEKSLHSDKKIETIIWDMIYTDNRAKSKKLAGFIGTRLSRAIGTKNRGVKGAPFYVLKWTNSPAVLVEIGFVSNKGEAGKLNSSRYKEKIAKAISDGILEYLRRS